MNALENLLAPYSDEIAKFAGTVTCLQFLSGFFMLNDIRKNGRSDAYPPEPLLGGLVLTVLSLKLGSLMNDMAMMKVNLIGFAINLIFMAAFYLYASSQFKKALWSKIGFATAFTMMCLAYSNFEAAEKIEFRFGLLITTILIILVGSPLLNLRDIIKKKSTEGLPFPFIISGTIVAAAWMFYGISIQNKMVTYQNLVLLLLSSVQLMLFAIYPNKQEERSGISTLTGIIERTKSKISNNKLDNAGNDKEELLAATLSSSSNIGNTMSEKINNSNLDIASNNKKTD